jgi:hypothetical protein
VNGRAEEGADDMGVVAFEEDDCCCFASEKENNEYEENLLQMKASYHRVIDFIYRYHFTCFFDSLFFLYIFSSTLDEYSKVIS